MRRSIIKVLAELKKRLIKEDLISPEGEIYDKEIVSGEIDAILHNF